MEPFFKTVNHYNSSKAQTLNKGTKYTLYLLGFSKGKNQ